MAATLDEHQQFVSEGGKPLVNGKVYYGDPGSDPKTVPKVIFSDPALTLPLANPQALDLLGRTVNKVYLDGRYSILVENTLGGQEYQNLFNGVSTAAIPILLLSNVIGATTITATTSLGITSYISNQQFVFKTISGSANTGPITLNVDDVGERDVVRNVTESIAAGEFGADASIIVIYNEANDQFQWVNQLVLAPPAPTPVGEVTDFAGSAVPSLWILCFGQAISRTTFSELFLAIGTIYGTGNGSTTFNLPDCRGRVSAGQDDMGGLSANRLTNAAAGGINGDILGGTGGEEDHTQTVSELAAHTHSEEGSSGGAEGSDGAAGSNSIVSNETTGSTGNSTPFNVVQPTIIFNKIIFANA